MTSSMMTYTPSAKLNRLIDQAEKAGLIVEVEHHTEKDIIESYSVIFSRPRWDEPHMLAVVENAERVYVYANRYVGDGNRAKAFKVTGYRSSYANISLVKVAPTRIATWLEMMAKSLAER